jgi:hypothetical protein
MNFNLSSPKMSALGQKQTFDCRLLMSAIPPKADIAGRHLDAHAKKTNIKRAVN